MQHPAEMHMASVSFAETLSYIIAVLRAHCNVFFIIYVYYCRMHPVSGTAQNIGKAKTPKSLRGMGCSIIHPV